MVGATAPLSVVLICILSSCSPQVIKYSMDGEQLLALGLRGKPGHDTKRFCKPTAVRFHSKWTACPQSCSIHA